MRKSTIDKLFRSRDEFSYIRSHEDGLRPGEAIHWLIMHPSNTVAMVHEFPNIADGFDVFVRAPGNQITDARAASGLPLS